MNFENPPPKKRSGTAVNLEWAKPDGRSGIFKYIYIYLYIYICINSHMARIYAYMYINLCIYIWGVLNPMADQVYLDMYMHL